MTDLYPYLIAVLTLLWSIAIAIRALGFPNKDQSTRLSGYLVLIGLGCFAIYIGSLWTQLERPPLRTLGETRLWYAFFLPIFGLIIRQKCKLTWFLNYTLILSIVFLMINQINPDSFNKALMPALRSVWFMPHVFV